MQKDKPISPAQRKMIFALCHAHGMDDDLRKATVKAITGKDSTTELTRPEAAKVINFITGQAVPTRRMNRNPPGTTRRVTKKHLLLIATLAQARMDAGRMTPEGLVKWGTDKLGHWPPRTTQEANRMVETLKSMNERDGLWTPSPSNTTVADAGTAR